MCGRLWLSPRAALTWSPIWNLARRDLAQSSGRPSTVPLALRLSGARGEAGTWVTIPNTLSGVSPRAERAFCYRKGFSFLLPVSLPAADEGRQLGASEILWPSLITQDKDLGLPLPLTECEPGLPPAAGETLGLNGKGRISFSF